MGKKGKGNRLMSLLGVGDTLLACDHFRDPVPVGQGEIWVSEYSFDASVYQRPRPDLGIYLADSWEKFFNRIKVFGEVSIELTEIIPYPAIIIDCADGSVLPRTLTGKLVSLIQQKIEAGKIVDIGCFGGHGRTGFLLACLIGKIEGLPARLAIKEARRRHCPKAVESRTQIEGIATFLGESLAGVSGIQGSHSYPSVVTRWVSATPSNSDY